MADDFSAMEKTIIQRLLDSLVLGEWPAAKTIIVEVEAAGLWPAALLAIQSAEKPHPAICEGFHTFWTERGHRIRELLPDDSILFDALRALLPAYSGPDLTLYRGESMARHLQRCYGTAWTSREDVALMFASGLNAAHEGGGVLLSTVAPTSAIITGPGRHSIYLDEHEYVVDRQKLTEVTVVKRFPKSFQSPS